MKILAWGVGIILSLMLAAFIFIIPFTGSHWVTGNGDHTGYITSVERTGIIFVTDRAYLKTSPTSNQEDAYCVVDPQIYSQLQQASVAVTHVNVHYITWWISGIAHCDGEDAVITSVDILPN